MDFFQARLWIQIMKELRTGVKLKKVQTKYEKRSIEYELTPYEILMDDLRSRRYTLNKVPVRNFSYCFLILSLQKVGDRVYLQQY
jgi:hypothetical protein